MPADFADCFFVTMIILKGLYASIVNANQSFTAKQQRALLHSAGKLPNPQLKEPQDSLSPYAIHR
jgi:hypothetical protein